MSAFLNKKSGSKRFQKKKVVFSSSLPMPAPLGTVSFGDLLASAGKPVRPEVNQWTVRPPVIRDGSGELPYPPVRPTWEKFVGRVETEAGVLYRVLCPHEDRANELHDLLIDHPDFCDHYHEVKQYEGADFWYYVTTSRGAALVANTRLCVVEPVCAPSAVSVVPTRSAYNIGLIPDEFPTGVCFRVPGENMFMTPHHVWILLSCGGTEASVSLSSFATGDHVQTFRGCARLSVAYPANDVAYFTCSGPVPSIPSLRPTAFEPFGPCLVHTPLGVFKTSMERVDSDFGAAILPVRPQEGLSGSPALSLDGKVRIGMLLGVQMLTGVFIFELVNKRKTDFQMLRDDFAFLGGKGKQRKRTSGSHHSGLRVKYSFTKVTGKDSGSGKTREQQNFELDDSKSVRSDVFEEEHDDDAPAQARLRPTLAEKYNFSEYDRDDSRKRDVYNRHQGFDYPGYKKQGRSGIVATALVVAAFCPVLSLLVSFVASPFIMLFWLNFRVAVVQVTTSLGMFALIVAQGLFLPAHVWTTTMTSLFALFRPVQVPGPAPGLLLTFSEPLAILPLARKRKLRSLKLGVTFSASRRFLMRLWILIALLLFLLCCSPII